MRDNKFILPIIIVMLVFFLPAAIYGTYHHLKEADKMRIHNHKENGKLYFYDENNKYIGIYECVTNECDDARNEIDDENFAFANGTIDYLEPFAGSYALIKDEDIIKLYNLKMGNTIKEFKQLKTYGTKIAGKYAILKDDVENYGLFNLETVTFDLPLEYEFVGVNSRFLNSTPEELRIAVKDDTGYFIVNNQGEDLSAKFNESIYDYTDMYVITNATSNSYKIYDYNANEYVSNNYTVNKIEQANDAFILSLSDGSIRIYENGFLNDFKEYLISGVVLTYSINDDKIEISNLNNEVIDTYIIGGTNE